MKSRCYTVLLLLLLSAAILQVVSAKKGGRVYAEGFLGVVDTGGSSILPQDFSELAANTKKTLKKIVKQRFGGTGQEQFRSAKYANKVVKDKHGHAHVRFEQTYEGIPVVDSAIVVHLNELGQVYVVNGEYVADGSIDINVRLSCDEAFNTTLAAYGSQSVWLSDCTLKIVFDKDGVAHKAWERMIGYPLPQRPYQNDILYASVVTGEIVAIRPQILGARAMRTEDCRQSDISNCLIASQSSDFVNTADAAVNGAHNGAIATYNYYLNVHGRDSIDNAGMRIVSRVHVGVKFNNAYWNGNSMNYGDGDGAFKAVDFCCEIVVFAGLHHYGASLVCSLTRRLVFLNSQETPLPTSH